MPSCTLREPCLRITSYNDMKNKPKINGVELKGNKTTDQLKLMSPMTPITNDRIDAMFVRLM